MFNQGKEKVLEIDEKYKISEQANEKWKAFPFLCKAVTAASIVLYLISWCIPAFTKYWAASPDETVFKLQSK
jgi:hypothetical protein